MTATVLLSALFFNPANAAADCTPCSGTIVYSGGSCFCYEKLPLDETTLDPIDVEDPDLLIIQGQIGLDMEGFCAAVPGEPAIGVIETSIGWAAVSGDEDVLDYWRSLNDE